MNIEGQDLNLLRVFHVVYQEGQVTRAAHRLSLSQPALSHQLNRLRQAFGDPLFVRAPRGLAPTPRAHALAPEVARLVLALESFYGGLGSFELAQVEARLHIHSTDYMEQTLLPRLLPRVRAQAPGVVLIAHHTRGALPRTELETGACDLAIAGFYADLAGTLRQQSLWSESFVVLSSRQHPACQRGLTLQDFVASEHVLTTLTGDLDGAIDRALWAQGLKRRVVAGLSSFLAPVSLVRDSDLLLSCLRTVAEEAVARDPGLVMHALPLAVPPVQVMQIWHERTEADPLRRWLRQEIRAVADACQAQYSSPPR